MSRFKQWLLVIGALLLIGYVLWSAREGRPPEPAADKQPLAGLDWLPAESALVAGVDLEALRAQRWLLELLEQGGGEMKQSREYSEFVTATGFDYARDLDRLWLALVPAINEPAQLLGVAEGRFRREQIVAYAERQGATATRWDAIAAYEVPRRRGGRKPAFAFAFLDPGRLAFAENLPSLERVLDVWQKKAPSVGDKAERRAYVERVAAGNQVWVVDDVWGWAPPYLEENVAVRRLLETVSAGARVRAEGVELNAEAGCRRPQDAQRLREQLTLVTGLFRLALAAQKSSSAKALGDMLDALELTREEDRLRARTFIPAAALAQLLAPPPASARGR